MLTVNPQYITDHTGKKVSAIISMEEFRIIMEELDDLEDLRLYDAAKMSNEPSIPIDEAFKMLDEKRKKN